MITNTVLWCVLGAVIAFGIYVRLAPADVQKWHHMPDEVVRADFQGGAIRVVQPASLDDLKVLDEIVLSDPRTQILAGDVQEGMITYVSRSKLWGFPDYTTVHLNHDQLEIYGRLRFGRSDLGVNAARIDNWLRLFAK